MCEGGRRGAQHCGFLARTLTAPQALAPHFLHAAGLRFRSSSPTLSRLCRAAATRFLARVRTHDIYTHARTHALRMRTHEVDSCVNYVLSRYSQVARTATLIVYVWRGKPSGHLPGDMRFAWAFS